MIAAQNLGQEFKLGPNDTGLLLITDAQLLIRPSTGQFDINFDIDHAIQIMRLGDTIRTFGFMECHVVTALSGVEAFELLEPIWKAYFGHLNVLGLPVDWTIRYVGPADSNLREAHRTALADAADAATVFVYTREYWQTLGSPDPTSSDWTNLLGRQLDIKGVEGPIPLQKLGEVLDLGLPSPDGISIDNIIVVRPSTEDPGYIVRGFRFLD